jgi:hypothetical protein
LNLKNKLVLVAAVALIAVVFFAAFKVAMQANFVQNQDKLYQVSAFNVFSAGNFEGNITY